MSQTPSVKHCPKCNQTKPIDDFYRNASAKDGCQCWCKVCWKADTAARKERDPERYRAQCRKWYYSDVDRTRERSLRSFHKRRAEGKPLHPSALATRPYDEKTRARRKLQNAVRSGAVTRQPCADCGTTTNVDAHHRDYSKPLEVEWLCRLCHAKKHREEQAAA